jgi:hypothetical protein
MFLCQSDNVGIRQGTRGIVAHKVKAGFQQRLRVVQVSQEQKWLDCF